MSTLPPSQSTASTVIETRHFPQYTAASTAIELSTSQITYEATGNSPSPRFTAATTALESPLLQSTAATNNIESTFQQVTNLHIAGYSLPSLPSLSDNEEEMEDTQPMFQTQVQLTETDEGTTRKSMVILEILFK